MFTTPQAWVRIHLSNHFYLPFGGKYHQNHLEGGQGQQDSVDHKELQDWDLKEVTKPQTCSWSQIGIAEGLTKLRSLGQRMPSSPIVNGCGIVGSWKLGETIMFSAKEGGFVGTGVLMLLANPTFLLRLANMIRKVNAYLEFTC
jgi:hypothetical protein